jgi:di/tricarboxylate transporter
LTFEIILVMAVIVAVAILFAIDLFSPDIIALGVIAFLVLSGILPLDRALQGIGSDTFLLVLGLLVMTAALEKTGFVDWVGAWVERRAEGDRKRFYVIIIISAAVMSAFMSNTGSAAFFLPIVIGIARTMRISRSKLLLPMAFAAILASSTTLISTSTNIVISGILEGEGFAPLGMFELTPVGLPILLAGILYLVVIAPKLIPDRPYQEPFSDDASVRNYLTELIIPPDSKYCGLTVAQAALGHDLDLTILRIAKDKQTFLVPSASTILEEGDVLLVECDRDGMLELGENAGLTLKPRDAIAGDDFSSERVGMFEVILLPRSPMIGHTLKKLDFRRTSGLQVLGINRSGQNIRRKLSEIRLEVGDQFLLHGSRISAAALDRSGTFRLLHTLRSDNRNPKLALLSIIIFALVLVLAALHFIPVSIAALLGMLAVFLTGCISPEEAYRMVNWQVLFLIGGMLALGIAVQDSGSADFLADQIIFLMAGKNSYWLLGAFFLLSMLLSAPMSNQAAAAIVVPVAIQTALQLGYNPRGFAVMIALGASCSFLTPLEPACMMVYGPGNYRFTDFIKAGFPLTVVVFIIALFMVPLIWPL